jgi:Peptidase U49
MTIPQEAISPREAVITLMKGTVPERISEIHSLWKLYNPAVCIVRDAERVTLNATKDCIAFDAKTRNVFWLIGFAGWRAIECYSPHVIWSVSSGQTVADLIAADDDLAEVERAYKERRAAAQALIDAAEPELAPWPDDLPRPTSDRHAFADSQDKVAFDLTCFALALALFHEFRHVMLDQDQARPADRREEELACDVWARDFMTAKLAAYARSRGLNYHEVLRVRSMGFALAALVLHEITPFWDHGGNQEYFSVATRMEAILDNTRLAEDDHFWNFTGSLLVGIFRQKPYSHRCSTMSARALTRHLIGKLK